jgi:LysR family glycine cleavage system transcriptional activator
MATNIPPLNAVKAFEAVVRSGSMARAAAELGVSPSAVSHQVKSLETWFARPLFDRQGRDLIVNDAGRQFIDLVRPAFEQLRIAADRLLDPPAGRVKVLVCPSLASIWLAPRLDSFLRQHSDIDIELHCRREVVDLNETDFDCALRYCEAVPNDHVGNAFMPEDVFPVCSPGLAAGERGLKTLEDLVHHTLLNDALGDAGAIACNWSSWFSEVGLPQFTTGRGHGFSDSNIMYEAACRGIGVALGRSVLVDEHIRSGRLVRPFDVTMRSNYSWHFLSTSQKLTKRSLSTFRDWLVDQTGASP